MIRSGFPHQNDGVTGLLLALLLFQTNPAPTGVATGMVIETNGTPAANVRVYAIPAGDLNATTPPDTAVFEGLAQTDAAGRYRLEIPVGRYYIAAGSVGAPTYYPDTPLIASARAILITAGAAVDGVNFSRYIPASQTGIFSSLPPGSTGVLSGIVKTAAGAPAAGVSVIASPVTPRTATGGTRAVTDTAGRYRIENVSPDAYIVVAGYLDNASVSPAPITTTPSTAMTALDFTLPPISQTTIRGHVRASGGRPAGGTGLLLTSVDPAPTGVTALLPRRSYVEVSASGDGSFEISGVPPGAYSLQARVSGTPSLTQALHVTDQPMDVDVSVPVSVVVGRIRLMDGSPVSNPVIREVALLTVSNPNDMETTVLPVSKDGMFSGVAGEEEYRFLFLDLPTEYVIRSITAGTTDLLKEHLHVSGDSPVDIDVRVALDPAVPTMRGRVVDAMTGGASSAERVKLCCFDSVPYHQTSAKLREDGSFEFFRLPPGSYTANLQAPKLLRLVDSEIEIGDKEGSNGAIRTMVSYDRFVAVMATIVASNGASDLPADSMATVTLTSPNDLFHVRVTARTDAQFWFYVPEGIRYSIAVTELPAGYKVKSIVQSADVFVGDAPSPSRITISLTP